MSLSISSKTPVKMPVSPLQTLLLIQLETEPKYGYEMLKTLKKEFKGTWEPRTGTVYPALKSLEKKGFVETNVKDGTEFYSITEKGKAVHDNMEDHTLEMLDFSVKYLTVLFKWMTKEKKKKAMLLMKGISEKEQTLASGMLTEFYKNLDKEIKEPFLKQIKVMTEQRLEMINTLIGSDTDQ
ncbi:MAG: PadR family transcriptional regulator [Candidatus Bathyarchaeota archaeon]|nr:PadR family transcriptional regulator [Candidatus Bathyarchaeota archaeon]